MPLTPDISADSLGIITEEVSETLVRPQRSSGATRDEGDVLRYGALHLTARRDELQRWYPPRIR